MAICVFYNKIVIFEHYLTQIAHHSMKISIDLATAKLHDEPMATCHSNIATKIGSYSQYQTDV